MKKLVLMLLVLSIFAGILYADGYPTAKDINSVYIVLKNGTGIQGYTNLFNESYDHRPPLKPATKGSDVLPFVLENYAPDDSLWVDTVIVEYGGCDFGLYSGVRHIRVSDVKSIFTLTNLDAEGNNRVSVNFDAYLTDDEYQLLLKGYTASLLADGEGLSDNLLLSCNPKFTQLDLYLYSCMMPKAQHDIPSHPFLNDCGSFVADLQDFYMNKNTKKSAKLINILKKCQQSWLTMAKYLQESQAILPEERANSIAKLNTLAKECDVAIQTITSLSKNYNFPTSEEGMQKLDTSIYHCVFPRIEIPCKDRNELDWDSYLLKRGIIVKYLSWD